MPVLENLMAPFREQIMFMMRHGKRVILATGYYADYRTTSDKVIGNVNPDWTGGIHNSFSYKNVSFSFLIDCATGWGHFLPRHVVWTGNRFVSGN